MKRTLDSFIQRTPKKPKYDLSGQKSSHPTYPFPIPHLPAHFTEQLAYSPDHEGSIVKENDLDIVYHKPYIPSTVSSGIFEFLRRELFFYRVQYKIKRGGIETNINTPRYTTVFGVDDTSRFTSSGDLVDASSGRPVEKSRYKCSPRPLPECLDQLRRITEATTGETFNFALVNYYADGSESISYHSDDERFLGPNPAIASFSFGAKRDFLLRHKEWKDNGVPTRKYELGSGDMVLMRGTTQAKWLHSIPKRAGADAGKGRINITFRKALVRGGTENYYTYNVGSGGVLKWDESVKKMMPWSAEGKA